MLKYVQATQNGRGSITSERVETIQATTAMRGAVTGEAAMSKRLLGRPMCQLIVLGLAVALAVLAPTAALATPPDTFRIPHADTFIDEGASAACGFDVLFEVSGIQTIQVLYDAAGNPIRVQVHGNIEGTVSANGITLREIERGQTFIDLVEGTDTEVGLLFRVFLPGGGTAIADVGRLVFDAEGNVTFEAGPHPALHGDFAALCAALS
jgi:hypothetical protein